MNYYNNHLDQLSAQSFINALLHLLDETPFPIFCLNSDAEVTRYNSAAASLLHITDESNQPMPHPLVNSPLKCAAFQNKIRNAATEMRPVVFEFQFHISQSPYQLNIYPISDGFGVICLPVKANSPVKSKPDATLYDKEVSASSFIMHADSIISIVNLQGDYIMVNDAMAKFMGCSREEMQSQNISDFLHPDEILAVRRNMDWIQNGENNGYHAERRYVRSDGRVVWVHSNTSIYRDKNEKPLGLIVQLTDITERKQVEEELNYRNHLFHVITELAKIGVWNYDIATDNASCSPETYEIIGIENGSPINRERFVACLAPEEREPCLQMIMKAVSNRFSFEDERRIIQPSGEVRWISGRGWAIYSDDGEPTRLEGVVMDITDRKKLEFQFRESQKMEGIGRLAGGIAHDFNNLLTVILGHAELMKRDTDSDHPLFGSMQTIETAALRAADLTRQLLTFARRQNTNPRLINLNDLLNNMTSMMYPLLGEKIMFVVHPASNLWKVMADENQIERVMVNMAVNARDAMPHGGKFIVETQNVTLDPLLFEEKGDIAPGDYVMVSITDSGIGMSQEVKQRVFEPFFTTKGVGKGTGLGLATCYGIVQQHGGYIHVYSELGVGTSFHIYLPRARGSVKEEGENGSLSTLHGRMSATILVVEDEEMVRKLMCSQLKAYGYHVIGVGDGEEALRVAQDQADDIDLMITDIQMPVMDGQELVERMCKLKTDMKVVFVSGYNEDSMISDGELALNYPLLPKPFNASDLLRVVEGELGVLNAEG